ncbi:MAG: hypothetical protein R3C28_32940 [Pirellulaceae bacterium]
MSRRRVVVAKQLAASGLLGICLLGSTGKAQMTGPPFAEDMAMPGMRTQCGPQGCAPKAASYGYWVEQWRRWPGPDAAPLSSAAGGHDMSPFIKPGGDVPDTMVPDSRDEGTLMPHRRQPPKSGASSSSVLPSPNRTPGPVVQPEPFGNSSAAETLPESDPLPNLEDEPTGPNDALDAGSPFDSLDPLPDLDTPADSNDPLDAGDGFDSNDGFDFDSLDDLGSQRRPAANTYTARRDALPPPNRRMRMRNSRPSPDRSRTNYSSYDSDYQGRPVRHAADYDYERFQGADYQPREHREYYAQQASFDAPAERYFAPGANPLRTAEYTPPPEQYYEGEFEYYRPVRPMPSDRYEPEYVEPPFSGSQRFVNEPAAWDEPDEVAESPAASRRNPLR